MIELKKANVHKIVETKEKALQLISDDFKVVKDEDNILGNKEQEQAIDYGSMTVDQLKAICKDNNLEGYSNLSKDDLVKFVQENIKK